MAAKVTRRDFLNGVAIGAGGIVLYGCGSDSPAPLTAGQPTVFNPPDASAYYPPTRTGMRGSHPGSFEVAHDLAWRGQKPTEYEQLDEHYDLVVVGAGASGLAAARYYQQKMGTDARVLILDNHDDFGGHAKRNEFHQDGRMMLSLGGAQNLENPSAYSEAAEALMNDIGIDQNFLDRMDAQTPESMMLAGNMLADNRVVLPGPDGYVVAGKNWNAVMFGGEDYEATVRTLPIPATEQDILIEFFGGERDFLDDMSVSEKWDYINSTSYNTFLMDRVGLAEETLPILNANLIHLHGISGWNLSVLESMIGSAPGIKSVGWLGKATAAIATPLLDSILDVRMFPDGNASIARLLVHKLIPSVATELKGPEEISVARFDYAALDRADQPTRLRLNSTAVGVKEIEGEKVQVDYVQKGTPLRVTADHCVLACYNALIPHLCPEMPDTQKEGLSYGVKTPFVYVNVQLKDGRAWSQLGATFFQCPYDPFQWVAEAPTMSVGGYEPPRGPDDPMVVFMMNSPVPLEKPGHPLTAREQLRVARHTVYNTSFEDYEQKIRDQLQSMLGQYGFNHEKDVRAITVNRIPHGYAYAYLALDDPEWEEGKAPHEIGRAQFGRISIANTDAEARAYLDAAFDAAWRAVEEQTA